MVESEFIRVSPLDLRPWVVELWYSRGTLERDRERVLPTMETEIVVNLGAPMELVQGHGVSRIEQTTVSGFLTEAIVLGHTRVHEAIGVRLSPFGLRAVLGVPPAAGCNLVLPLAEVDASGTDSLYERCVQARPGRGRLDAAIEWLRERIAEAQRPDPVAAWAVQRIVAARGRLRVAELQRASGYGETRFNARFRDELGLTPKQLVRIARFDAALDALDRTTTLADVAHACGYADQAHMNRDFRALAGVTPTTILADRNPAGVTVTEGEVFSNPASEDAPTLVAP